MSLGAIFVVAGVVLAMLAGLADLLSAPWAWVGVVFIGVGVLIGSKVKFG